MPYKVFFTCCLLFIRQILNKSGRVWVQGNAYGVCALAMRYLCVCMCTSDFVSTELIILKTVIALIIHVLVYGTPFNTKRSVISLMVTMISPGKCHPQIFLC